MRRVSPAFAALGALLFAATALAHAAHSAVDARRGYFQAVGFSFGGLVAMAKGEKAYDPALATVHARNLRALAGMDLDPFFPKRSDATTLKGDTRALPKIWSDAPGFAARIAEFRAAVDAADIASSVDLKSLRAAVSRVAASCKSCHDAYRAKKF